MQLTDYMLDIDCSVNTFQSHNIYSLPIHYTLLIIAYTFCGVCVFIACTISLTTAGDIPRETGSTTPVMFVALSSSTGPDSDTMTDIRRRTCTIEISQTWWTMYTVMHIYKCI